MPNILARLFKLSVNVNGLLIPGQSIENVLSRSALNLVINNDDDIFKISLKGSATAVRFQGREILLVSQHQLQGVDESQVAIMTDNGSHTITSAGRRGYPLNPDTDVHDIVAFDFTEPCNSRPELKSKFYNLASVPPEVPKAKILAMLLLGYPSAAQTYNLQESNSIGLARLHVPCLPHPSQPSDHALLRVKPIHPLKIEPDGMSGGAAFVIQNEDGGPKAYFAGIIIRAGRNDLYILRADVVVTFLNNVVPTFPALPRDQPAR